MSYMHKASVTAGGTPALFMFLRDERISHAFLESMYHANIYSANIPCVTLPDNLLVAFCCHGLKPFSNCLSLWLALSVLSPLYIRHSETILELGALSMRTSTTSTNVCKLEQKYSAHVANKSLLFLPHFQLYFSDEASNLVWLKQVVGRMYYFGPSLKLTFWL